MLKVLFWVGALASSVLSWWALGRLVVRFSGEGGDAFAAYIRRQFRLTWRMIPKLVFLAALVWPLKIYLFSWLGEYPQPQTRRVWCVAVFLIPVIEEVMFRGLIFQALRERYCFLVGLVLGAVLFAASHDVASVLQLLPFFLSGIGYVLVYAWTGSLVPAILMHGGWNALVLALAPI